MVVSKWRKCPYSYHIIPLKKKQPPASLKNVVQADHEKAGHEKPAIAQALAGSGLLLVSR